MRWAGVDSVVARAVEEQTRRVLDTYRVEPGRVEEDANLERSAAEGAYAKRQVFELLQNAADALRDQPGRCEVLLTDSTLYVANQGSPLSAKGVETLMAAHRSVKRDEQIGRFGLGFKSVLAVSDSPRLFSRSGSLLFDREEAVRRISQVVPGAPHYPISRVATATDPKVWATRDPELKKLMEWATTVVVLPLRTGHDIIAESMRTFPAQFVLFSPHVTELGFDDRVNESARLIGLKTNEAGEFDLLDSNRRARWVVVSRRHRPTKAAFADGGYQAARDAVQIQWAVPIEGAQTRLGSFWAYFPTSDGTTLSGIVNAPWKLADDRASLLNGAFNEELLTEVLPSLVVEALPRLVPEDRPAAVIDALPARGKEARNDADDMINEPIMRAVSRVACIPTMAGGLAHPVDVRLHPDGVDLDDIRMWASGCVDPQNWVHQSIVSPERRSKVSRLMAYHERTAESLRDWVEHLVDAAPEDKAVEASGLAVRLVARLCSKVPEAREELLRARVLLLEDGTRHVCRAGEVFVRGSESETGRLFIDPVLASDRDVIAALSELGIHVLDRAGHLKAELAARPIRWERVWPSSRRMTPQDAEVVFRDILGAGALARLQVRSHSGIFRGAGELYLPGVIVPADGSRDRSRLVDPRYHKDDLELLSRLGMVSEPQLYSDPLREPWRTAAEATLRDKFRERSGRQRTPDSAVQVLAHKIPWPMEPMTDLSAEGRAALMDRLLVLLSGDETWEVGLNHGGDRMAFRHPVWNLARRHGFMRTQAGLQPVARCLAYDESNAIVDGVQQPLPYVSPAVTRQASAALKLKRDVANLMPPHWEGLFHDAGGWDQPRRTLLYAWGAFLGQAPPNALKVGRGRGHADVPASHVAVATTDDVYESLLTAEIPVVRVSNDDAGPLIANWGMHEGSGMLVETLEAVREGDPIPIIDAYPPLRNKLEPEQHDLLLQKCSALELQTSTPTGQRSRPLPYRLDSRTLLTTARRDEDILRHIAEALELRISPATVLRQIREGVRTRRRQQIIETGDVLAKLVLAIGRKDLIGGIPSSAIDTLRAELGRPLTDEELAGLALAVHGYDVLQNHRAVLDRNGLEPPSQWAGRGPAREWVKRYGFPAEYAGFTGESRPPEIEIEGPPTLKPLHDYQETIAARIKALLAPDSEDRRGLVPLPTGAGKTRVAVQALVEHMVSTPGDVRVVWVAETEELCEQAVQTWSYIWRAMGDSARALTLSRLWGSGSATERDGLQVVVATIAKLDAIQDNQTGSWKEGYGWLARPAMIVVDEAHKSIAPSYSRALSRLGGAARTADMTTPLVGLTATPFRGYDERGTDELIKRYHRNRLDLGVFGDQDPYTVLQGREILARVRHQELQGASVELSAKELENLEQFRQIPDRAERALGDDSSRNRRILESLLELPSDSSVLLFAASVDNARVLAALLSYHGIEARAVSGTTDRFARRRYIEDFRRGDIRVLTNYNVFTEGFDVPSVDAVYVTRPTYSPNVYQQMVGRGLRGPKNGGSEEVLIVNVADNITNYGEQLAFRHFDHLWNRGA